MINLLLKIFARRRRELAIKEVELFKLESEVNIKNILAEAKHKMLNDLEEIMLKHKKSYQSYCDEIRQGAISCANDTKKQEHDFHTESAERKAEIKILDKQIEFLEAKHRYIQEIVDAEEKIKSSMVLLLNEKQEEIDKLSKALDKLTN